MRLAGIEPPDEQDQLGESFDDGQASPAWIRARQMALARDARRRRN